MENLLFTRRPHQITHSINFLGNYWIFIQSRENKEHYIHIYHSRFIPEGVVEVSDISPRHPRFTKISWLRGTLQT
jgi:hypothetical protein